VRALALVALLAVACGGSERHGAGINVDRAMTTITDLSTTIGPRVQSTDQSRRTEAWIEAQLTEAGIPVEKMEVGTVELPAITVMGALHRQAHPITVTDPNLIVRFGEGSGKALLLMAHYDTVDGSPGAIDNSASVAILMEVARALKHEPPPQPVIIAFTAAEEAGLVGAEALAVEIADRVSFAIALDLVGGDGELVVNGASTLIGTSEMKWLADAAERAGAHISVPAAHRVVSRWWPLAERSDHGPFTRRGTRAIHFYNRGNDGEWIDLAYHSKRDVPSRVKREAVAEMGRLLWSLILVPVPPHGSDGFWVPFVDGVVVPRTVLIAFEIVLVLAAIAAMIFSRAGLLAWFARSREGARGPALLLGVACYAIAIVAAIVLEKATNGDQLAPWLYAPARAMVGYACVIVGVFGLATRLVARFSPWRGESRFGAVATLMPLAVGGFWFAVGAPEVAWVWLVPAAAIALAPLIPLPTARASMLVRIVTRLAVAIAVALSALPIVLALHPDRLREAVWNGFLPVNVPITALLALLGIPVAGATSWALRRRNTAGPMGTLVLGLGCALLVIAGLVVTITSPEPCTPAEFARFLLACDRV